MPITLNSKVYNWAQFDPNGVSRYLETSAGVPTAFSNLTAKVTVGTGKSQKVKWRLAIPTVATDPSACACPGEVLNTDYIEVTAEVGSGGSLVSRQDLLARLRSLVLTTQFGDSINNLVQPSA